MMRMRVPQVKRPGVVDAAAHTRLSGVQNSLLLALTRTSDRSIFLLQLCSLASRSVDGSRENRDSDQEDFIRRFLVRHAGWAFFTTRQKLVRLRQLRESMSLSQRGHPGAAEPGAHFLPKLSVRKGAGFPSTPPRWSASRAKEWFAKQQWRQGANFLPSSASNQFEMFQADTFDEATISRELGWAAELNFNAVRVFLHNAMWTDDAKGFLKRVDTFLRIADSHGIGTMLVLFDGCWDPHPKLGKQLEPRPRVHNSRWVQAPGAKILGDPAAIDKLEGYVKGVVGRYANDSRVLLFDVFNEPDNANSGSYSSIGDRVPSAEDAWGKELKPLLKAQGARSLIAKALRWSREIGPSQPLTVGVYWAPSGNEEADQYRGETGGWVLGVVDVTSFHNYDQIRGVATEVLNLKSLGRPVICSEYMARGVGSTFDPILGYFRCEPAAQVCLSGPCSLCTALCAGLKTSGRLTGDSLRGAAKLTTPGTAGRFSTRRSQRGFTTCSASTVLLTMLPSTPTCATP